MIAPIRITSLDDPRIAAYRNVRDADLRGRDDLFLCESEMVVRRALNSPYRLESLLLSDDCHAALQPDLESFADRPPVYLADEALMIEISGYRIHGGALASGRRPPREQLRLDVALEHLRGRRRLTLLIAEGVTNIDNMGGLFRNAAAFGVDGILLDPTCCDPLFRKAIRVSMGHALSVPFAVSGNWPGDLARLREEWNITLLGAETIGSAPPVWTCRASDRLALLVGSEGHGLSAEAMDACDQICSIPMAEGVPSLNVATASAVFLYELMCRRGAMQVSE